ncbi:hypothetical protein NKI19_18995 [Mesorhizobium sp. M0751]|uniref:hypothetical protein n=1 Tax=unclassified Mesorhizobium TaxID=325217 RepID=UPI00333A4870
MSTRRKINATAKLIGEWPLTPAATFGSSVRARGIFLEIRARLPTEFRKLLNIESRVLTLRMSEGAENDVQVVFGIVSKALQNIEDLPVIPREIEDILTISTAERHRWLKDGRLQSAGTKTVKLRGRARNITFHVFDPQHVEDVLDRDLVTVWREQDAATAAENRRRAAGRAAMKRAQRSGRGTAASAGYGPDENSHSSLRGWEDFENDGLLR